MKIVMIRMMHLLQLYQVELPTQLKDFALLHKTRNFLIISQKVTGVKIYIPIAYYKEVDSPL